MLAFAGEVLGAPERVEVGDPMFSDVTTRAFSTVWAFDEPVVGATVKVYADADGSSELTSLRVALVSPPEALVNGVVKVDVSGLEPSTPVYVRTETTTDSGTSYFPSAPPYPEVLTQTLTTKADPNGNPIVNDLLRHEILDPSGVGPAAGVLLAVGLPDISIYPLTSFSGDGFGSGAAVADLNNLYDTDSGISAVAPAGSRVEIGEYRGRLCDPETQLLRRFRRVPAHEEDPPITELEAPSVCFAPRGIGADFDCDGTIGPADFNEFLLQFGRVMPDCAFNSDFDLVRDDRIDPIDFNQFLRAYGASE